MAEDKHSHDSEHSHQHDAHGHSHDEGHGHSHGAINPSILTTEKGIWAVKWSFVGLFLTTIFQIVVYLYSGSVALLADTIHNLGDAFTAIPLAIAFMFARRKSSKRFTYGFGRVEDLAGVMVVLTILASAIFAGYESIQRLITPQIVTNLWAVAIASVVGFLGNEAVALFRIKVGKEIGSAALVADGYHARTDGLTSLAVLFGAIGVWFGFPLADPIIGLLITLMIVKIVWESAASVFTRLLDGVEPDVVDEIRESANSVAGVENVTEVRVRWLGHRLYAELNIAVNPKLSVSDAHTLAMKARHELLHKLPFLSSVVIHIDPIDASGEEHHQIIEHTHDDLPLHSHV